MILACVVLYPDPDPDLWESCLSLFDVQWMIYCQYSMLSNLCNQMANLIIWGYFVVHMTISYGVSILSSLSFSLKSASLQNRNPTWIWCSIPLFLRSIFQNKREQDRRKSAREHEAQLKREGWLGSLQQLLKNLGGSEVNKMLHAVGSRKKAVHLPLWAGVASVEKG